MRALWVMALVLANDAAGQDALIARMRDAALNYADRLQDFICTETMVRSADTSGAQKHWGNTSDLDKRLKKGYLRPGGEFGTSLLQIFTAEAEAKFEWDREELVAGNRSCIFRYRVPLDITTQIIICDTGAVTRIQRETEPASVRRMERNIAFGLTPIRQKEFLPPQEAAEISTFYKTLTKAEIRFTRYRKYYSNSDITLDDPPPSEASHD